MFLFFGVDVIIITIVSTREKRVLIGRTLFCQVSGKGHYWVISER